MRLEKYTINKPEKLSAFKREPSTTIPQCNAMQCYAMLCNAMQCYAMLSNAMQLGNGIQCNGSLVLGIAREC